LEQLVTFNAIIAKKRENCRNFDHQLFEKNVKIFKIECQKEKKKL